MKILKDLMYYTITILSQLMTVKKLKKISLAMVLTFYCGTTFSQTTDNSLTIFPNPFADSTNIHFNIVQSDTITLQIFNTMGQTVKTLFQSTILPSGSYNVKLLGDSLAVGIYIIRLEIGKTKRIVKKFVRMDIISGITDDKTADKILIFPNPTNDYITIPVDGNKTIIVADMNGKIVKSFTTNQQVISLSAIAKGQYLITILTDKNKIIARCKILKSE